LSFKLLPKIFLGRAVTKVIKAKDRIILYFTVKS